MRFRPTPIAALAALPIATAATAGPLDLDSVPARAALVLHVDIEACLGSPVLGDVVQMVLRNPDGVGLDLGDENPFAMFDVDASEAIKDITIIALDVEQEQAIVRMRCTDDVDVILDAIADSGRTAFVDGPGDWDLADMGDGAMAVRRNDASRTIILSDSSDLISGALEAERGFGGARPPRGAMIYAASNDIERLIADMGDLPPGVDRVRSAVVTLADEGDGVRLDLGVRLSDNAAATGIASAVNGAMALAKLSDHELGMFADMVKMTVNDDQIRLSLRAPREMMQELMEEMDIELFGGDDEDDDGHHGDGDHDDWGHDGDDDDDADRDERGGGDRAVRKLELQLHALEEAREGLAAKLDEMGDDVPEGVQEALESAIDELDTEIDALEAAIDAIIDALDRDGLTALDLERILSGGVRTALA